MKRSTSISLLLCALAVIPLVLQAQTVGAEAVDNRSVPQMRFEAQDFVKLKPGENLGEVLGVAVNSKGEVAVLNHPGSATTGPLFGNATTEILLFDRDGHFIREIGRKVYALGYGHSIRYDRYDNLWIVDKGTDAVIKFDPSGKVLMNLGRRPEGFDSGHIEHAKQADARAVDGWLGAPTDVTWDQDDNIYVSDGYVNSRIAKFNKVGKSSTRAAAWGPYSAVEASMKANRIPSRAGRFMASRAALAGYPAALSALLSDCEIRSISPARWPSPKPFNVPRTTCRPAIEACAPPSVLTPTSW